MLEFQASRPWSPRSIAELFQGLVMHAFLALKAPAKSLWELFVTYGSKESGCVEM